MDATNQRQKTERRNHGQTSDHKSVPALGFAPYLEDLNALAFCFAHLELIEGYARGATEATLGELKAPMHNRV
jgi:hypothetical protein